MESLRRSKNLSRMLLEIYIVHTACCCVISGISERIDNSGMYQQSYPNLYFSMKDVQKLRKQARTSHARIYNDLAILTKHLYQTNLIPPADESKFNSRWNTVYGDVLEELAFYCTLTPDDKRASTLVKLYMERLYNYTSWMVTGKPGDELPLAHSLGGFVTAFDLLYHSFTTREREGYVRKIMSMGSRLYTASLRKWWGRSYIHNHVVTNYMALLTAAIVIEPYYPYASSVWQERSVKALDATMKLLRLVVDGSFQEGVSYGSYTMRGLTQFLAISKRHFNSTYTSNIWLKKHFDFLLYNIIPGFLLTVGFADCNLNWAYGPVTQLYFLDNYVMKDGRGNRLAEAMITHGSEMESVVARAHSQLRIRFLFYNESLKASHVSKTRLHVFADWGVMTYGGGSGKPRVFLALKCSHVHGRAINMLRRVVSNARLRNAFAPGHEQPDQGSFVFITKDQEVVTETRYSFKHTYLQNTLMFGPSNRGCTPSFLGQLGECHKWLNYKRNVNTWLVRCDLVGYSRDDDLVFMSGDMTSAYDGDLGLSTVYRVLITLKPNVLIVCDVVRFMPSARTYHVSSFFHNANHTFAREKGTGRYRGATVGKYRLSWRHLNARTDDVTIKNRYKEAHMRYETNFINITWRRTSHLASTVYVFHAPQYKLRDLKVSEMADDGLNVSLKLNSIAYDVILAAGDNDPKMRWNLLGTYALGKIYRRSPGGQQSVHHLGLKTRETSNVDVTSGDLKDVKLRLRPQPLHEFGFENVSLISVVILLLGFKLKSHLHFWKRLVVLLILVFITMLTFVFVTSSHKLRHSNAVTSNILPSAPFSHRSNKTARLNSILITGLPASGVDVAREMFTTNSDFLTMGVSSDGRVRNGQLNLNHSTYENMWRDNLELPRSRRVNKEYIYVANPLNLSIVSGVYVKTSRTAILVICIDEPRLLLKTLSLLEVKHLTPLLYVVRDPRSWVEHMLGGKHEVDSFLRNFQIFLATSNLPTELQDLRRLPLSSMKPHIALAHIWSAFTRYALKLAFVLPGHLFKIVHFHDVIKSPRATADDVYSFLNMPFRPAVEHRIVQVAKSGLYHFEKYGTITPMLCTWGKLLNSQQLLDIEKICGKTMSALNDI